MGSRYWPDDYLKKRILPQQAIRRIQSGQRIFIGTACGEPQCLVRELAAQAHHFADLEIMRLLSLESSPLTSIANKTQSDGFNIRTFYSGSVKTKSLARNKR
ncbi:MAG: acetyl-CoA hydrolase, partial [Desulfobacca sp.]|nr:acetyl-CoA hydrolase [Desulfobacca sp.]